MSVFSDVEKFYRRYTGEKEIIGFSSLHRPIFAVKAGKGRTVGIVQGGMHGREWVTAYLVMAQAKLGVDVGGVWYVPLVNPDGALLSECGLDAVTDGDRKRFLLAANGQKDFSLWKANGEGVDLNVNFDADWGTGLYNLRFPSSANYIGESPFSAAESRALRDLTLRELPSFTVSYHTQGEEIYWRFYQPYFRLVRDKRRAAFLSAQTGYPLKETPGSAGGYKDWCVRHLHCSAFTIEVGKGEHPLNKTHLHSIMSDNIDSVKALNRAIFSGEI